MKLYATTRKTDDGRLLSIPLLQVMHIVGSKKDILVAAAETLCSYAGADTSVSASWAAGKILLTCKDTPTLRSAIAKLRRRAAGISCAEMDTMLGWTAGSFQKIEDGESDPDDSALLAIVSATME